MEESQIEAVVNELVESRMADIQLAIDDIGWKPLGQDLGGDELDKGTLEETSDLLRAMVTINPLVKRGVAVRTSYIWGKGIQFEGVEETHDVFTNPLNKRFLFSSEALAENERALATDGNFFVLAKGQIRGRRSATSTAPRAIRIPFKQITAHVCNPENPEEVWFYRREWTETTNTGEANGDVKRKVAWYPSDLYEEPRGKRRPQTIQKVKIDWSGVLIDHCVNKQVGWRWGIPDAMSVIFWAKSHKEFLEDQARLVKAYSRFAFKATAPTPKSVKAVATKVGASTATSPHGLREDIGGTAVMAPGANLQAVGRTSGSVDFSTGLPLASYVAAGLEIPLTDLLSDSSLSNRSAAETLTASKLAAMVERQKSWASFFERLFAYWGKENVKASFQPIEPESTLKLIQAVSAASALNVLHAEEVREMIVAFLQLDTDKDLPTEEELGLLILAQTKAEEQAQKKADSADPSYGDNSNRDDLKGGAHEYDPTDGQGEQ